jgi:hypothetical protein
MNKKITSKLIKIANSLDKIGLHNHATDIDNILKKSIIVHAGLFDFLKIDNIIAELKHYLKQALTDPKTLVKIIKFLIMLGPLIRKLHSILSSIVKEASSNKIVRQASFTDYLKKITFALGMNSS